MRINNDYKKTILTSLIPFKKAGFSISKNNIPPDYIQVSQPQKTGNQKLQKGRSGMVFGALAVVGVLSAAAFMLIKNRRINPNLLSPGSNKREDYKFILNLAQDIGEALGKKINPEQLDCVMGKTEFQSVLSKLSEQNYILSAENISRGIFKADLHSHSWHSDGWGIVENILNDAATYGDKLNAKTGEKFIFALTDHDGLQGVKEVLELIVSNPEKYKNIRFVPGVELSFIHECQRGSSKFLKSGGSQFEGSELLVHCINPYSKKLNSFVRNLQNSRGKMIQDAISELNSKIGNTKFLREEMSEFYLKEPDENFAYNLHWRVLNYAQVKNRVTQIAQRQGKDPQELYASLMREWHFDKNAKSLDNFNNFLASKGIGSEIPPDNDTIASICRSYFPKIENGEIIVSHENTFDSLIKALSEEKDISAGFAHPAFLTQCFTSPKETVTDFIKHLKGIIQTTEKYHQGYFYPIQNGALTHQGVDNTNSIIDEFKLLNMGGRDNHKARLFE